MYGDSVHTGGLKAHSACSAKQGAPQPRKCRDISATFSSLWGPLYGVLQHLQLKTKASKSGRPNSCKTAYSCNAESFCTLMLMSAKLCGGPDIFTEWDVNPAMSVAPMWDFSCRPFVAFPLYRLLFSVLQTYVCGSLQVPQFLTYPCSWDRPIGYTRFGTHGHSCETRGHKPQAKLTTFHLFCTSQHITYENKNFHICLDHTNRK